MDTKTFMFNSSAKYQAGGHFKWKTDFSLTNQQLAVDNKASHFQAKFQDDYQNPPLTGDVEMANKAWNTGKAFPLTGGSASLISLFGAPLLDVVFHSRTTSKL